MRRVDLTAGPLCPSDVRRTHNVDSQALSPRSHVAKKQQSTRPPLVRLSNRQCSAYGRPAARADQFMSGR